MKNIKLKQTNLCFLISLMPLLAAAGLFAVSVVIGGNAPEESVWQNSPIVVIAAIIAGAIFFIHKFGTASLVLLAAMVSVEKWKKDRQFYFTDVNGKTLEEASRLIKFRMNHYAKELPLENKSKENPWAYKKRRHSWNDDTSGFEDFYILYETQNLTKDFCSNAVAESKSIMRKYAEKGIYPFLQTRRERKTPVTRACALVIICDRADFDAGEFVRRNFSKGHTGLAVCICEISTGRYFFNGAAQSSEGILTSNAEEIAVNLIKKSVFCKKLGLRENSYYMPTHDLPYDPERTLYEVFADIKKDLKRSDNEVRHTVKRLKDGEVYFDGELVYYKKGERTLTYSVIDEDEIEGEEKTDRKTVFVDKTWSYPKTAKMSKADYAEALKKIEEYLKSSGIDFEFKDFEKWLEEQ